MEGPINDKAAFHVGDLVSVKNMPREEHFCIIGFKNNPSGQLLAILKALFNDTFIIEKPLSELNNLLTRGLL